MEEITTQLDEVAARLIACCDVSTVALDDEELLAFGARMERIARVAGAAQIRVAGEIAARARPELGDEGLSRSQNFATPSKLLAAVTGISVREAKGRLDLGSRMRGAALLGGAVAPDPYPRVAAAMQRGDLGVECAAVITKECSTLSQRGIDPGTLAAAEEQLVDAAVSPALTADDVVRLAVRIRETLDPDGLEPRAEAQHEARSLTLSRASDGMYRGRIALAPEDGALWLGALQAMISPRTAPRFVAEPEPESEPASSESASESESASASASTSASASEDDLIERSLTADTRTGPQKMADAATELISRAVTAPEMPHLAGSTTTVNVHVALADLESDRGAAWVDGLDEPLPLSTVQRLCCSQTTAVTVFGERGEVLHHGKTRRLFTPAQNRALAARDGGCVWPGCDRPPSWCESHHIDEWKSREHAPGTTDICNGVLLCRFHHGNLHRRSAWKIVMRAGVPHLVPPRWIDVTQTPIPVTRRRTVPPDIRIRGASRDDERRTG